MPRALVLQRKMSLRDPRHLMRFLKVSAKMSPEDIAKAEGVSVSTVKDSIRMIEQYQAQNSSSEMEFAIRSLVVHAIPKAKDTLDGLLDATELVEISDPNTGKKKHVTRPDKTTRIEAMRIVTSLVRESQPKGPLAEVNVNQNMQVANLSSAETTEERMRRLRKQAEEFNKLPPEVAGVPDSIDRGDGEDDDDEDGEDEDE